MISYSEAERKSWYAVGLSSEYTQKPTSVRLLGEALVIWRNANGQLSALRDLCIHRGTALSLGKTDGCEIVCPYHGWRFNGDGICTFIPQLTDPCRTPKKAKIDAFQCQERYDVVWVALDEPLWSLPDIPELESNEYQVVATGPFAWKASAARQVENFTDFAHFPFVHPELLGDPSRTLVPSHRVMRERNILRYQITRPEAPNTENFPIFGNKNQTNPVRTSTYELHLPYTIVLRISWGGKEQIVSLFSSSPVDRTNCRGYYLIGRNYNFHQPDELIQQFEEIIFGQDQQIVESQRPEQVPFDLSAEIHLRFDSVAVSYRKAMAQLGYSN